MKKRLSQEDIALFRQEVDKLRFEKPLTPSKKELTKKDYILYDDLSEEIEPNESLFFARTGLQQKALRELKQGKIRPMEELDLHGMTVEPARNATVLFIQEAIHYHYRCVRIIHGKGKILKNHINSWLKQIDDVLAFASAIPKDGGTGAVYVILKSTNLRMHL